jgi:glycosyltransferase involved in cell wall biosynthesis
MHNGKTTFIKLLMQHRLDKMTAKKVCIVTRYFPKDYLGGGESVIFNIWKWAKSRYRTSLVSGWVNSPELLPPGTLTIDLRSKNRFLRYLRLYFGVKRYVSQVRPDLIHTNTMEIPSLPIPTIVMVHHIGHYFGKTHEKGFMSMLRLGLQRWLVKRRLMNARHIVAVSHATKADIVKLGIHEKKVEVIHNGIDVKKFLPKKTRNKKFVIVCPSRISPEKGQEIAINAIASLPQEMVLKIELVLVGFVSDTTYLESLRARIRKLPVRIITNVRDITPYYQKADIVIFPTQMHEGFGLVAAEAMCCAKPVIASDFPAIREVVGTNGLLVAPGDTKALSSAILHLFNDEDLRRKLGRSGRAFVLKQFTWDEAFKKYEKLYKKVLA